MGQMSKVIDRIVSYIGGEAELTAGQLAAAHILLNKFLSDRVGLASTHAKSSDTKCNKNNKINVEENCDATKHDVPKEQKQIYFKEALEDAADKKRIRRIDADPLREVFTYWDLGVTGLCTIWVVQFLEDCYHLPKVHVADYYEARKTPLWDHLKWVSGQKYSNVTCILPHDGAYSQLVTAKSIEAHIQAAGFATKIIPNPGKGAAQRRIEAVLSLLPFCWFDKNNCRLGLKALAHYHEQTDRHGRAKSVPSHDWASHAADSFGLMALDYEQRFLKIGK